MGFGLLLVGAGLCDGRGRPEAVSRRSARSEARTYDLDAVEDGRMMAAASGDWDGLAGLGLLVLWVGGARRDALPYLGARTVVAVRRRDDRWGDPRGCSAVARSFRADQRSLTTGTCRELTAGHQLHFGHGARDHGGQAAWAQAASPRARRVWWVRRASLRATDSAARLAPARALTSR